jgi:hypothetical protein
MLKQKTLHAKVITFKAGDYVLLKREEANLAKGLMLKLAAKGLGPYKVISADKEKGNVTIEVAGQPMEVKHNQVHLAKVSGQAVDEDKIIAAVTETIPLSSLKEIEKLQKKRIVKRNWTSTAVKSSLKLNDLVGRRVAVDWGKSGKTTGIQNGTIIGYTNNFSKALVFYDKNFTDGDRRQEYYGENLQAENCRWKFLD